MKRRQFITLIGGAAAAWPLTARGQVTRTRPLIARLSSASWDTPIVAKYIERFLSGMRELGYVEGRDFDMTYGWADFHPDQLPRVAAEVCAHDRNSWARISLQTRKRKNPLRVIQKKSREDVNGVRSTGGR
jgi:hypothetical protein